MPSGLAKVLTRVHELAAEGDIELTDKANAERLALGFDIEDVREVLKELATADSAGRSTSRATGEWLYVFKPQVGSEVLYVKLLLRGKCVIVSFHEDEGEADEAEE